MAYGKLLIRHVCMAVMRVTAIRQNAKTVTRDAGRGAIISKPVPMAFGKALIRHVCLDVMLIDAIQMNVQI